MSSLISTAKGQVGTAEVPLGSNCIKYNTWYYGTKVKGDAYPWCAVFVAWVFDKCGRYSELKGVEYRAYCPSYVEWAKNNGKWVSRSKKPKAGWLVLYDWNDDGEADHIGFVEESISSITLKTIEGNRDDMVKEGYRGVSNVLGYIKFDNVVKTAKKSNEQIAHEVIDGLWGNGSTRKKKLQAAGYSYSKIQKLVNQLIKEGKA